MKYAPIVSPPFHRLVRGFEWHMAEAPLVLEHKEYRKFYKMRPEGVKLILDNGAALSGSGGAIPFDGLMTASYCTDADEIVIPDIMYEHDETLELAREYAPQVLKTKRFLVPQGRTAREWLHCASEMIQKYVLTTIGVPKHLDQLPGGRTHILAQLKKRWPLIGTRGHPSVHLLGVWNDSIEVLWLARRFPWLRSIDTSIPEANAVHSCGITSGRKFPYEYLSSERFRAMEDSKILFATVAQNISDMTGWANGKP